VKQSELLATITDSATRNTLLKRKKKKIRNKTNMRENTILLLVLTFLCFDSNNVAASSSSDNQNHGRYIVKYKNQIGLETLFNVAKKLHHHFEDDQYVAIDIHSNEDYEQIKMNNNIESIEIDSIWTDDGIFEKHIDDPTTYFAEPENRRRHLQEQLPYGIGMVQANLVSLGTNKATVCIVDTGVFASHPDFDSSLLNGINRYSSVDSTLSKWNNDTRGHGTHITGIVNAKPDNNYGVRGIGKIPVYITRGLNDQGKAYESDIRDSMEQCEKNTNVKVISLSLSGGSMTDLLKGIIDRLYGNNITVVAAAGNGGKLASNYPASYNKVISVGAVTSTEKLWAGSNYGPYVELTAPGDGIVSTGFTWLGDPKLSVYSGTSMATPHVAGAAAILFSHYPDCTPTQIRYALAITSKDQNSTGCDQYFGFGIVQIKSAFEFLRVYKCPNSNWGKNIGSGSCSVIDVAPKRQRPRRRNDSDNDSIEP
jgi:subtilisin family serine protease